MKDADREPSNISGKQDVFRILDANLNRAREAFRTIEDYARFVCNDALAASQCKRARHQLTQFAERFRSELLKQRDTVNDIGTLVTTDAEARRDSIESVVRSALGRATEALRCIEEYGKIVSPVEAAHIERLRYDCYTLEQRLLIRNPLLNQLRAARLHVLITEALCRHDWQRTVTWVLEGGADVIQLREKNLDDSELLDRAGWLREQTRTFDALCLINDRADIARLVNADGVHLGQDDLEPTAARKLIGPGPLIGVSTHNIEEASNSRARIADYLGVGTMFSSPTKPDVCVGGPALLARIVAAIDDLPLVAIGGITTENVNQVVSVAPLRVAVAISQSLTMAEDVRETARRVVDAIDSARASADL